MRKIGLNLLLLTAVVGQISVAAAYGEEVMGLPSPTPTPITEIPVPFGFPKCSLSDASVACAGKNTKIHLSAQVSGFPSNYTWDHNCGPNAVLTPSQGQADLDLSEPGDGFAVNCTVTLTVSNVEVSDSCSAQIEVAPCAPDCESQNIEGQLFKLDGAAFDQRSVVREAVKLLRRLSKNHSLATEELTQAQSLYTDSWNLAWSVPALNVQCATSPLCVKVDNTPTIDHYLENANNLKQLALGLAKRLRKLGGLSAKRLARRIVKKANLFHGHAEVDVKTVPQSYDVCSQ